MTAKSEPIVKFDNVDIVFGNQPEAALPLIDAGKTRAEIQEETGQILGVANCSLEIEEGEVSGTDGTFGIGKVNPAAGGERTEPGSARQGGSPLPEH